MERSRRRSVGRTKSPAPAPKPKKSPVRSRSRGRPTKNEAKRTQSRSKSRSGKAKAAKPRDKSRDRSKSPKPKSKRAARSASRTRSQTSGVKVKDLGEDLMADLISEKKLNLVLKDVLHDDFSKDSQLNEIIRRSISRDISQEKASTLRRSTRISTMRDSDESSRKVDGISKSLASKALSRKPLGPEYEFGGWLGALIIVIALPLLVLTAHLACTREQCTLSKFHIPRNWHVYFNLEAAEIVLGFVLLQAILSVLPIGRRVSGPPGRNGALVYRCNGFLSAVLTAGLVAGLWYYKFPVTIVYERLIPLLVSSSILAYVLGVVLFIKGGRAPVPGLNPHGIIGNKAYQFVVGREVNPIFFGRINVKVVLLRTCLIAVALINALLVLKAYEVRKQQWSPTLLTSLGLSTLYVIDFFWFEDSFSSTFEAQYEGTGCLSTVAFLTLPFFSTLTTKYIVQHKIELPVYALVAIALAFVIGFAIQRASNLQKSAFRRNPLNPALAHFETISTSRGKKLLVSGWWGWVRHPNYLGEIILFWALASTAGFTNAIPYSYPLLTTLILIHRSKRDDTRCSQRYQSAWEEYRSRVKYHLFPHIY